MRYSSTWDTRRVISRLNDYVILGNRLLVDFAKFKGRRQIWKQVSVEGNSKQRKNEKNEREECEKSQKIAEWKQDKTL